MTERRYSISEIDRMRQAIWNKLSRTYRIIYEADNDRLAKKVEDELRAVLLAGVDPDDLVASCPEYPSICSAGYGVQELKPRS